MTLEEGRILKHPSRKTQPVWFHRGEEQQPRPQQLQPDWSLNKQRRVDPRPVAGLGRTGLSLQKVPDHTSVFSFFSLLNWFLCSSSTAPPIMWCLHLGFDVYLCLSALHQMESQSLVMMAAVFFLLGNGGRRRFLLHQTRPGTSSPSSLLQHDAVHFWALAFLGTSVVVSIMFLLIF